MGMGGSYWEGGLYWEWGGYTGRRRSYTGRGRVILGVVEGHTGSSGRSYWEWGGYTGRGRSPTGSGRVILGVGGVYWEWGGVILGMGGLYWEWGGVILEWWEVILGWGGPYWCPPLTRVPLTPPRPHQMPPVPSSMVSGRGGRGRPQGGAGQGGPQGGDREVPKGVAVVSPRR